MFKKVILSLIVLVGCADTEKVVLQGLTGATGAPGKDGINGVDGSSCVIQDTLLVCGGSSFNLSQLVGPMGPEGVAGVSGTSCIVAQVEGGAQILCGNETSVFLHDGINGQNGTNGENGQDGQDGKDGISVVGPQGEPGATGPQGNDGTNGTNGTNGSSCSVTEVTEGALIYCTDGSSVLIPFVTADDSDGEDDDDDSNDDSGSVTICHKPGTHAENTLHVAPSALPAHLGHGDSVGKCDEEDS